LLLRLFRHVESFRRHRVKIGNSKGNLVTSATGALWIWLSHRMRSESYCNKHNCYLEHYLKNIEPNCVPTITFYKLVLRVSKNIALSLGNNGHMFPGFINVVNPHFCSFIVTAPDVMVLLVRERVFGRNIEYKVRYDWQHLKGDTLLDCLVNEMMNVEHIFLT